MNTLIIYVYEEQSIVVLLDENETILVSDYANGMMWTIENSLIKIFGEELVSNYMLVLQLIVKLI